MSKNKTIDEVLCGLCNRPGSGCEEHYNSRLCPKGLQAKQEIGEMVRMAEPIEKELHKASGGFIHGYSKALSVYRDNLSAIGLGDNNPQQAKAGEE